MMSMQIKLKYGNTNTFFIRGTCGNLLIDTDYAGTLNAFYKAIKEQNIKLSDITFILATHYHPDHIGLVGELMNLGVKLLVIDTQYSNIHFADNIFSRDKRLAYKPIHEDQAIIINPQESREFLENIGIYGEIIATTSHSLDSVSLILDSGDCFVGDLEPMEYLAAYEQNDRLRNDWKLVMCHAPKRIYYAHANEKYCN